jgi:putative transcriptional regulator
MIVNRVSRLMGDRRENVSKLAAGADIAYTTAQRLYYDKTERIDFKTLDSLCRHFGVGVGAILEYQPDERD